MSGVLTCIIGICLIVVVLKLIKGIVKFVLSAVIIAAVVGVFLYLSNGGSVQALKEGTERYTEIT